MGAPAVDFQSSSARPTKSRRDATRTHLDTWTSLSVMVLPTVHPDHTPPSRTINLFEGEMACK